MRTALIALSALALAGTTTTAMAGDRLVIPYADLNLTSEAGQKALDTRIELAVRDFCQADAIVTGTRVQNPAVAKCLKTTRAAARQQMATLVERRNGLGG